MSSWAGCAAAEAQFGVRPVWAAKGVCTGQPAQMLCHMDRPDWTE